MGVLDDAIGKYRKDIDGALREALINRSDVPIYGMLRYFMGFENENGSLIDEHGGKRVRSALLLLAADALGGSREAMDLAVAVELFHNFTLIHDDIEDGDELRRGRPTIWKVWGINHGINSGDAQSLIACDFLLKASATSSGREAAQFLMQHFVLVAEGQYLDFELTEKTLDDSLVTEDAYLEMTRKKTSVLIGAAAAAGGIASGCDEESKNNLYSYGENLGLAYQIADDIASLWASTDTTGKAKWGDVYERKKTLPIFIARAKSARRDRLDSLYASSRRLTDDEVREVMDIIEETDAYTETKARALLYAERAKEAARKLPVPDSVQESLVAIVDGFVTFPK